MELIREMRSFIDSVLKGMGQIMLQENSLTGLLILVGIFYGSPIMGMAAIVGVSTGTLTAKVLRYKRGEVQQGLYGFSAALVGVALALFFKPIPIVWGGIILGSVAAAAIQHFFLKRNIPVFTLPFVLVTWVMYFLIQRFVPDIAVSSSSAHINEFEQFEFAVKGFGQVIFQDKLLSGALFFIAVFVSAPNAALYGLAGAVLAAILSLYFGMPVDKVGMGLFSFNAVLCAIVFAGNKTDSGLWGLIAVGISLIVSILMFRYALPQLTFPFVVGSCIVLIVKRWCRKNEYF